MSNFSKYRAGMIAVSTAFVLGSYKVGEKESANTIARQNILKRCVLALRSKGFKNTQVVAFIQKSLPSMKDSLAEEMALYLESVVDGTPNELLRVSSILAVVDDAIDVEEEDLPLSVAGKGHNVPRIDWSYKAQEARVAHSKGRVGRPKKDASEVVNILESIYEDASAE